ncbi:MAG: LytTR family DNA-binding domain-containing protein [Herbinix sp.]|nr:LytTR family DNA-binding domain-containing protein [Herbinix sp.]
MKINIVLCDDENMALKINCTYIEELVKKYKIDANVTGFISGDKLIEYLENYAVDIAFLDIDLKGTNGIAVAARILKKNPRVIIIFITSHREFAYDAFTVEAFSYITKPIDSIRLERIFKRAIIQVNYINNRSQRIPLIITENNLKRKICQSSILYIERLNSQSVIFTKSGKHCIYETITSLADRLEDNFLQINQGIIINLEEVALLEGSHATMKTGEVFQVGRTYSKEVKKRYLEYPQV